MIAVRLGVALALALLGICGAAYAADRPITVRDDVGRTLSGAQIRLEAAGSPVLSTSDGQGVMQVPREAGPSDSFVIEREGNVPLVITGATLTKLEELILLRAATLAGVVRDPASGAAVKGARVEVTQTGEGKPASVVADESGRFTVKTLAPGPVTLRATAAGYLTTVVTVSLAPASAANVDVALAHPANLKVGAENASKQAPAAGVAIEVRPGKAFPPGVQFFDPAGDGGKPLLPQARDAAAGSAETAFVVPMGVPLEVRGRATGLLPAARALVARQATESARLTLPAGVDAIGRFADEKGRPVAGIEIRPRYLEPEVNELLDWAGASAAKSKEDGSFRIGPLPPGTLALQIEQGDWVLPRLAATPIGATRADLGKVVLRPGASLAGKVVRKSTGEPVAGARVRACFEDLGCAWTLEATSAKDGTFKLGGASKGKWTLEALHPELPTGRVEGVSAGSAQVRLELPDGGTLTGRVLGPDGSPLGKVRVQALPTDRGDRPVLDRSVDTNDGRFEVRGAPPGDWTLTLRAAGFAPVRVDSKEIRANGATDVGDIVFFAGRVARGTVLGRDDARVAGAVVKLRSAGSGELPVITGADGRFEVAGLPDGSFQLVVLADGFAPSVLAYQPAKSGEPLELPERGVRLSEGGTIEGEVRGESDAAVSGARIRVPAFDELSATATDLQGKYRLEHVPAGELTVQLIADPAAPEGWTETRRVSLPEGATQRVDFTSGDTVEGTVKRRGQPVPFARITAVGSGGTTLVHSAETDADGEFRLHGISDGTWTLHVASADCQARFPVFRVAAERDKRLDLELPPEDVAGFVLDEATGKPLSAAEVSWSDTANSLDVVTYRLHVPSSNGGGIVLEDRAIAGAVARTAPDGAYRLCAPAGGNVEVEAAAGPEYEDAYAPVALPTKQAVTIKLKPKGNEVTVVVLRPDGGRASRDAAASLVQRGGFYEVMPVGSGGEVKFSRPKAAFRAWAGIPGVGLGVSDWVEEDAEVREPVSVNVTAGGYVAIRGLGTLRRRAAADGVDLDIRLVDTSGEDLVPRADSLGVLTSKPAESPDEEVLGPFPNGRYKLTVAVGTDPAGTKDVDISSQVAEIDLTP